MIVVSEGRGLNGSTDGIHRESGKLIPQQTGTSIHRFNNHQQLGLITVAPFIMLDFIILMP
jgi:hypothetical protein